MDKYKIYPKQYRSEKIAIQKNKCFVLMQFSNDLDEVYGTIKEELDSIGFICNRADDIEGSPIIFNKILTEMLSSHFIIVELSHKNPNVFYELGIAHSFKEPSNIILIKQKPEEISSKESKDSFTYPFDLRHLQYIEYTTKNLKLLTSRIKKYINNTKYLADFYEILNIKGIIHYVSADQEDFVEYIRTELGEKDIVVLTEILNGETMDVNLETIETFFFSYENVIRKTQLSDRADVLDGILRIYFELILNCQYIQISEMFLTRFLDCDWKLNDCVSWKIDLLCKLVLGKKLTQTCLTWIIEYFCKLRSTNIDLNRYKLERLLLTCNYEEVNDRIIDSLYNSNCHVREVMADLIGEKRLKAGLETLFMRLEIEENNYVTRSIVEAIGKIGDTTGITRLLAWFEKNRNRFEEAKYYGIYNHMTYALQRMDTTAEKKFFTTFIEQYRSKIDIPGISIG